MANDREIVRHDVELGRKRLYHQPKDVRDPHNLQLDTPRQCACPDALKPLHDDYCSQIAWAADEALKWWRDIVVSEQELHGGNLHEAALRAYDGWPAGPSANEMVVSTVRRFWLAADKAGRTFDQVFLPEDFLLTSLDPERDAKSILVLTSMPYWPIGLDEHGNWC